MVHQKYSFYIKPKKIVNVNGMLIKTYPVLINPIFFIKKSYLLLLVHLQIIFHKNLHITVNDNGNISKRDFNFIYTHFKFYNY